MTAVGHPVTIPAQPLLWTPVQSLADLDVTVTCIADGGVRVQLVDKRTWVELVSLSPRAAATLAGRIAAASVEPGGA